MLDRHPGRYLATRAHLRLLQLRGSHVSWGRRPVFWDAMTVIDAQGTVALGDDFLSYNAPFPGRITAAAGASVEIGSGVLLNYGAEIFASSSVKIGDGALVADMASIYDTNFHPVEEGAETTVAPVAIGTNVWVGRMAIVLPGVTIGEHSVVAAGSVVTGDVPPRVVVAGSPAKIVREGLRASDSWRRT